MKRLAFLVLLFASLPVLAQDKAPAGAQKYVIDEGHSHVLFGWNHFGFSNPTALLEKIDGSLLLDTADITKSSIEVTLPLAGLHTSVDKLDEHLKGAEFFDAAKYPTITFKSTKVVKAGAEALKVTGDLTVHGVTKPVTLEVKINKIGVQPMDKLEHAGFDATATIKRSEFGVGKYAPMVSDEVPVHITLDTKLAK